MKIEAQTPYSLPASIPAPKDPLFLTMEKELTTAVKSRCPGSFLSLVNRYQHRVINICFGFLKNKQDAEDVSQEVFIEVYRSLASFREEAKLSTWIYRIAVTKSLDHIRNKTRKKRRLLSEKKGVPSYEEENIPDPSPAGPEARFDTNERRRILYQAVDSLPQKQRTALILSKLEGFSSSETAEVIGVSLSSVEALIHRAKRNLRKKLEKAYGQFL